MDVTVESIFTQSESLCDDLVHRVALQNKLARLLALAVSASVLYGASMGIYHSYEQAAYSAVKLPSLFLFTLAVCLPTLHFVGLLFGSPVRFGQSLTCIMTGICQTCVLLGAFAPISFFFYLSRSKYSFLVVMHVAILAFCGAAGLVSVYRNFERVRDAVGTGPPSAAANHLLKVWMLLYMFVGTQMAFNLSPFINPNKGNGVHWFNVDEGNFYTYVWDVIVNWR